MFEISGYIDVLDRPSVEESRTFANLRIYETPEPGWLGTLPTVVGARVLVGGVEAPGEPFEDQYRTPLGALVVGAEPDGTVEVTAEHPRFGTITARVNCPEAFSVTSPENETSASSGSPLEVRWEGPVFYDDSVGIAYINPWDPDSNRVRFLGGGGLMNSAEIGPDTPLVSVTPPDADEAGYALDVTATGPESEATGTSIVCTLTRRVHLFRE